MPNLHLPVDHTNADLVLAGQVAELMESEALYVTWTPTGGHAAPEVETVIREPVSPWAETLGLLLRAVGELLVALTTRRADRPAPPATSPAPAADASRPHPAA